MKKVTLVTMRCTTGGQYFGASGVAHVADNEVLAKCLYDHKMLGIIDGIGLCTVSKFQWMVVATPLNGGPTYIITMAECSDFIMAGGVFITENIGAKK